MRAIEVFCCSGGMAEGFRRAGITFAFAFDRDPDACDSYEANLGHRPIQMDARDLLRMVLGGWSPGRPDLVIADPPCTPWSRAGKRLGTEDERDMLGDTAELIRLLRPRAYLIGNVPGLQDSTQWHNVQDALAALNRDGYCVADYVQLDAADYGVPQRRIRPFWYGHLDGPCVRWPAPTHTGSDHPAFPGMALLPWVTCRDALGHLPVEDLGRPVRMTIREQDHAMSDPAGPARTVTRNKCGDGSVLANRRHPPASPASPAATIGAKDRGQGTVLAASEWPWDRPATTVLGDPRLAPPGHHDGSFLTAPAEASGPNAVVLSERAASILQGFPEGWVFAGKTKRVRWSQLGQAMPPPLAEAVARSIVQQVNAPRLAPSPPAETPDA